MNRLFNSAFGAVISQLVKQKIREGSIKAVKAYITVVKNVRFAVMGVAALAALSSILVTGAVLAIVGLIGLIPMELRTFSIVVLVVGLLLAILSGVAFGVLFSQKRWLELSKSYDLMNAVLTPWPGVLPPNPLDVVKTGAAIEPDNYEAAAREMATTGDVRTTVHQRPEPEVSYDTRGLEPQFIR